MKKHRLQPVWKIIVAQIAAMALVFSLTAQTAACKEPIHLTSGLRMNNGQLAGVFGARVSLKQSVFLYLGSDLAGNEGAGYLKPTYKISLSGRSTLWIHLGPQVELVETEPDPETVISYLTAATGATYQLRINQTHHFWTGFDYLTGSDNIDSWKIGIGIVSTLQL
jgi:hypothetical protein